MDNCAPPASSSGSRYTAQVSTASDNDEDLMHITHAGSVSEIPTANGVDRDYGNYVEEIPGKEKI